MALRSGLSSLFGKNPTHPFLQTGQAASHSHPRNVTATYMEYQNRGSPSVTAWFDSEGLRDQFLNLTEGGILIPGSRSSAEIVKDSVVIPNVENVASREEMIDKVNFRNRPAPKDLSGDEFYGVEIIDYLRNIGVSEFMLQNLNSIGNGEGNCFNASLVSAALLSHLEFTDTKVFVNALESARPVMDDREIPGSIRVWFERALFFGPSYRPIHTAFEIGAGWVITKRGKARGRPYRLQRLEDAMREYGGSLALQKSFRLDSH